MELNVEGGMKWPGKIKAPSDSWVVDQMSRIEHGDTQNISKDMVIHSEALRAHSAHKRSPSGWSWHRTGRIGQCLGNIVS